MELKKLKTVLNSQQRQWVGNGFFVHGIVRPTKDLQKHISPFLLMDYASPKKFTSTEKPRGVGMHPHRGFETVTLSYQGEVEHRDSSGGGGVIKPGDVQWMTAGRGIVHDEFHSHNFSQQGGQFEMVQLWVNLPKKEKMTAPKYQGYSKKQIPNLILGQSGNLRLIAGKYKDQHGPFFTFTPINMYDLSTRQEEEVSFRFKNGSNTLLLIRRGSLSWEKATYDKKNVLVFEQEGEIINLKLSRDFEGLILNGEPINEPVVAHGPFVMNTQVEISQAIADYQAGKMGQL